MEAPRDPLAVIDRALAGNAGVRREASDGRLRLTPLAPDGFEVVGERAGELWTVHVGDGWMHRHLDDPDEVIELVRLALSRDVRLREIWRGRWPALCRLERREDDRWVPLATTGFFLVPWWRRPHEHVRRNAVVQAS